MAELVARHGVVGLSAARRLRAHRVVTSDTLFLSLVASAGIFQFFAIGVSEIFLSVYFILAYCLLLRIVMVAGFVFDGFSSLVVLLLGVELISFAWSPNWILGLRDIAYTAPILALYLSAKRLASKNEGNILLVLKTYCTALIFHSILVICFRFIPDVEASFLGSRTAHLFINPNALRDFLYDLNNNVVDPIKSGGFFLNANTGAVISEAGGFIAIAISAFGRKFLWRSIAAVHFTAAIASGSKSALALVAITPVAAYILMQLTAKRLTRSRMLKLFAVIFGALAFATLGYERLMETEIGLDAQINALRRAVIWKYAGAAFWESPLLGQGYGGWAEGFAATGFAWREIGIHEDMPAHNSLIILWSQSGLLAPCLGLLILATLLRNTLRARTAPGGALVSGSAIAFLFSMFVHSLGDNFALFGESHIQVPVALLFGWISHRATLERGARYASA